MNLLDGKITLVTGGASGIGEEIVRQIIKNGGIVCLNFFHSQKTAKKLQEEFGKKQISLFQADLTNEAEVQKIFRNADKEFGRIDFLINNAGIGGDIVNIEDQSLAHWNNVINTNLSAKFLCLKQAIPLLEKSKTPKVVNIASRLSEKPLSTASAYCCAAAGIHMLTKVAALELACKGIKVNTISPGFTDTPMTRNLYSENRIWENAANNNPSGRVGLPVDIANVVLFLLSDKSDYINGENINVNGGSTLI